MLRKLAVLALVATLGSAAITICPAGSCPLVQRMGGECCKKGPGLKARDCCPSVAAAAVAPWLATTHGGERPGAPHALAAFLEPTLVRDAAPSLAGGSDATARGASPPATLLHQHSSLLL
jgi:hypothetical protein